MGSTLLLRFLVIIAWLLPVLARAETGSLFAAGLSQGSGVLIDLGADPGDAGSGSLFIGRDGTSFFRPFPVRVAPETGRVYLGVGEGAAAQIRNLIAAAEAGPAGYNAVQYGARVKPPRLPTQMTVAQIYQWIDDTPGQPHAIGRYQFIPATLRRLVTKVGVSPQAMFSPDVQDKLANALLVEAGFNAMQTGEISRHTFMANLAKIWAGLPTSNGKSHYDGYAGNKATMSWARFDAAMVQIFPG